MGSLPAVTGPHMPTPIGRLAIRRAGTKLDCLRAESARLYGSVQGPYRVIRVGIAFSSDELSNPPPGRLLRKATGAK
jgi:hypothetical protein